MKKLVSHGNQICYFRLPSNRRTGSVSCLKTHILHQTLVVVSTESRLGVPGLAAPRPMAFRLESASDLPGRLVKTQLLGFALSF